MGLNPGIKGVTLPELRKECRVPLPSRSPRAGAGAVGEGMSYGVAEAAWRKAAGVDTKPHQASSLGPGAGTPGQTRR